MVKAASRNGKPGYLALTLEVEREGRQWVSRCVELDVASCGDDIDEALRNVVEATTQYLNAIEGLGQRKRIFAERGLRVASTPPRAVPVDRNLPIGTVVQPYLARIPA